MRRRKERGRGNGDRPVVVENVCLSRSHVRSSNVINRPDAGHIKATRKRVRGIRVFFYRTSAGTPAINSGPWIDSYYKCRRLMAENSDWPNLQRAEGIKRCCTHAYGYETFVFNRYWRVSFVLFFKFLTKSVAIQSVTVWVSIPQTLQPTETVPYGHQRWDTIMLFHNSVSSELWISFRMSLI